MHILVTADTLGGVWTYTRELVTGLVRRGEQVTLVSFGNIPSAAQTRWMEELETLDYRPTAFRLEWMLDSEPDMRASAQYLEAVIQETRPDLLHLSQFYYGALECSVPRVVVAHSDVVSWWLGVHKMFPPESEWLSWYRNIVSRGLAGADAVVAPSRWMLEQTELHYGKLRCPAVVYNGRTATLFNPYISKEKNIVTLGRLWDGGKNAVLLIKQEMPAPVRIIGPDHHPDLESSVFAAETLPPNVRLEPKQEEYQLVHTLAHAGIYAATSQYEPFGLAPVEAAFSRCALVASDIPTFRELWDDAAIFFRNNDPESLRDALVSLLEDAALRRQMGNRACRRAQQCFTADRMVSEYMNLYHSLAPARALIA